MPSRGGKSRGREFLAGSYFLFRRIDRRGPDAAVLAAAKGTRGPEVETLVKAAKGTPGPEVETLVKAAELARHAGDAPVA
jgi:hypothetical protein